MPYFSEFHSVVIYVFLVSNQATLVEETLLVAQDNKNYKMLYPKNSFIDIEINQILGRMHYAEKAKRSHQSRPDASDY